MKPVSLLLESSSRVDPIRKHVLTFVRQSLFGADLAARESETLTQPTDFATRRRIRYIALERETDDCYRSATAAFAAKTYTGSRRLATVGVLKLSSEREQIGHPAERKN